MKRKIELKWTAGHPLHYSLPRRPQPKLFIEIDHLNRTRQTCPLYYTLKHYALSQILKGGYIYYRTVGRKVSCGMNFIPCMEVVFMNGNVRLKATLLWIVIMVCFDYAGLRKR